MRPIKWDHIKSIKSTDNIKRFNSRYSRKHNTCSLWGEESIKSEENIHFSHLKATFDVYRNSSFLMYNQILRPLVCCQSLKGGGGGMYRSCINSAKVTSVAIWFLNYFQSINLGQPLYLRVDRYFDKHVQIVPVNIPIDFFYFTP